MHSWSTFGARTSHEHTWIHKIHHDSNLGETTTIPLIVLSMISHGGYTQMSFCPEIPSQVENSKIPQIGTPSTLEPRNFLCKPSIEVRFEANL
jgi:hypothetical protein